MPVLDYIVTGRAGCLVTAVRQGRCYSELDEAQRALRSVKGRRLWRQVGKEQWEEMK